jgi:pyroglutamyl-peptidase
MINAARTKIPLSLCCAALFAGIAAGEEPVASPVDRYVFLGFGPFAGRQENASWQSLKQFSSGTQISAFELPVVWGAPRPKLLELTREPGRVVLVGLGEGTSSYEVETAGFNQRGNIRDESGATPSEQAILPRGEERLEVSGPTQQLAAKLTASGFPAHTSKDAGRFLCNEMLYELLRLKGENPNVAAVYFIHVPVLGSQLRRGEEKITVDHDYCAAFGRTLVAALRELHPLVELTTASAR